MTTAGELIEANAQEPETKDPLPDVTFKVDHVYKATPEQLAMLEQNRQQKLAEQAAMRRATAPKNRLEATMQASAEAHRKNGHSKKNGAPKP